MNCEIIHKSSPTHICIRASLQGGGADHIGREVDAHRHLRADIYTGEDHHDGLEGCRRQDASVLVHGFSHIQFFAYNSYLLGWQNGLISGFALDFNNGLVKEHLPESKVQGSSPSGCLMTFYNLCFSHHF